MRRIATAVPHLVAQCQYAKLPEPVTEFRFHPTRRWRLDASWPALKLAVEIDGGGFIQGRHSTGVGLERDAEKFAEAAILGWIVIRVTPRQVKNGIALEWIARLLQMRAA